MRPAVARHWAAVAGSAPARSAACISVATAVSTPTVSYSSWARLRQSSVLVSASVVSLGRVLHEGARPIVLADTDRRRRSPGQPPGPPGAIGTELPRPLQQTDRHSGTAASHRAVRGPLERRGGVLVRAHDGRGQVARLAILLSGAGQHRGQGAVRGDPVAQQRTLVGGRAHQRVTEAQSALVGQYQPRSLRRSQGWRGWAVCSVVTAILVLVFAVLSSLASSPDPNAPFGLFQRVSLFAAMAWIALVAWWLLAVRPLPRT
jgi:hypothetical protein